MLTAPSMMCIKTTRPRFTTWSSTPISIATTRTFLRAARITFTTADSSVIIRALRDPLF